MGSNSGEVCSAAEDPALIARVSLARILFGHQSVGGNILQGLEEIAPAGGGIPIHEWDVSTTEVPRGILHFRVGDNGDPVSKIHDFEERLVQGGGAGFDAAGFKFCFDDIGPETDIGALFRAYDQAMARIRDRFPRLRIYHLTVPLTTRDSKPKAVAKWILRRPSSFWLNKRREAFNHLLRSRFGDDGLLFDLAAFEAQVSPAVAKGLREGRVLYLSPRFTEDGAHLDGSGKRLIACRWLEFLARVSAEPNGEGGSR